MEGARQSRGISARLLLLARRRTAGMAPSYVRCRTRRDNHSCHSTEAPRDPRAAPSGRKPRPRLPNPHESGSECPGWRSLTAGPRMSAGVMEASSDRYTSDFQEPPLSAQPAPTTAPSSSRMPGSLRACRAPGTPAKSAPLRTADGGKVMGTAVAADGALFQDEFVSINGSTDLSRVIVGNSGARVDWIKLERSPIPAVFYRLSIAGQGPSGVGSGSMYIYIEDEGGSTESKWFWSSQNHTLTIDYRAQKPVSSASAGRRAAPTPTGVADSAPQRRARIGPPAGNRARKDHDRARQDPVILRGLLDQVFADLVWTSRGHEGSRLRRWGGWRGGVTERPP